MFSLALYSCLLPRSYCKSVIDYCKKPGNERLVKMLGCIMHASTFG